MADSPVRKVQKIYICTSNRGKLRDFSSAASAFGPAGILMQPLPDLEHITPPEENGSSFEQNAIQKAVYYSSYTSELVVADDSGLEVESLAGAPGIHSARYAGIGATDAQNNALLLAKLGATPERKARFVCVLALAQNEEPVITTKGSVEGTILGEPQGTAGFGYDPLFFYPPLQRSFAELTPEEKLGVSHRGIALQLLFEGLRKILPA